MKLKSYTVGEILRLGLLKNHKGEAYKHKATISRIVRSMGYKKSATTFGDGYLVSEKDIKRHNKAIIRV